MKKLKERTHNLEIEKSSFIIDFEHMKYIQNLNFRTQIIGMG